MSLVASGLAGKGRTAVHTLRLEQSALLLHAPAMTHRTCAPGRSQQCAWRSAATSTPVRSSAPGAAWEACCGRPSGHEGARGEGKRGMKRGAVMAITTARMCFDQSFV